MQESELDSSPEKIHAANPDYDEEGDFSEEGFENFFWECHAYPMDIPAPGSDDIASAGGDDERKVGDVGEQHEHEVEGAARKPREGESFGRPADPRHFNLV